MRVLLIEDYSGFHKNLKEGLIELGHDVHIATRGDGFKETTTSDLPFFNSKNKIARKLEKIYFPIFNLKKYYGYDIVQLINHDVFGGLKFKYNQFLINRLKANTGKLFVAAAGTDYFVYNNRNQFSYNPYDESLATDFNNGNPYIKKEYIRNNKEIISLVDGIIPIMYDYALAYRNQTNVVKTIPLPINTKKIDFIPQTIKNNKLKIFHGLNRTGFKGTKYIKEAMFMIKEKYPDDVELIIDGKMPLKKYLELLKDSNIVIDQALSYSYGMNAVYSMAMGKVVLSGNEPECQEEFCRMDIPIINIKPSVEDIYNKLEKLVLDKTSVIEIGKKSRLFVEEFHNHVKVAQQYIDTWNSVEGKK